MSRRILLVIGSLIAFAALAAAADVTGKWVAQVPGRDGQTREQTFTFKADGATLTGTMSGMQGAEIQIADGKISGDNISFTATMQRGDNTIKWTYTGTVAGDEIKMKREGGQGQPREFVAKRVK
jgi:hypothetical protein